MTDNPKEYPYPIGPLAESFPPLSPARHAALVVRIAQHSFRPAVIVWREEIIFGVALLKAYKEAINAICPYRYVFLAECGPVCAVNKMDSQTR